MTKEQEICVLLLKKKGTGATMGKTLDAAELVQVSDLLKSEDVHLTTRATLLTAILMLPVTEDEKDWINALKQNSTDLPEPLKELLIPAETTHPLLKLGLKAMHYEDLSEQDVVAGTHYLLDPKVPEHYKAVYLESLRLKRETLIENKVSYTELYKKCSRLETQLPTLIDISDPYDGFNRNHPLTLFLAPLLAACGYPVLLHGLDEVGPKKGLNPHKLLKVAGKLVTLSLETVKNQLENTDIRWGYCDQSVYFPALYALKQCRLNMVKRPLLATLEKCFQPIRNKQGNCMVTGYTHPPYKQKMADILEQSQTTDQFLILRGVEGSTQLPLDRRAPYYCYNKGVVRADFVRPEIEHEKETFREVNAEETIDIGIQALKGEKSPALETLLYMGKTILTLFGFETEASAKHILNDAIRSGKALAHFDRHG